MTSTNEKILKIIMDKNKLCIILCCLCISMSTALAQKTKKRSVNNKCTFVEKDAVNDRDFWFPENPSMNQIDVVNDAESAAMIVYVESRGSTDHSFMIIF